MLFALANRLALLLVLVVTFSYSGRCVCCVLTTLLPAEVAVQSSEHVGHGHGDHSHGEPSPIVQPGAEIGCTITSSSSERASASLSSFQEFVLLTASPELHLELLPWLYSTAQRQASTWRDPPPSPPPRFV